MLNVKKSGYIINKDYRWDVCGLTVTILLGVYMNMRVLILMGIIAYILLVGVQIFMTREKV